LKDACTAAVLAAQQALNTECDVTRNMAVFCTISSLHAASRSLGAEGAARSAAVLGPTFRRTLYNIRTSINNVTLRRVRVTIVAVEKQQVLPVLRVSVVSDIHHAVLYCHLWPVRLYNIFPHYFTNDTIFGKMILNMKFVF
jgi:hypothetical protein